MSARGEQIIVLPDGREIVILFTNRALADVENRLNAPIVRIAGDLANGQAGITQTIHLLRAGMEAGRRDRGDTARPDLNDAYEVMDTVGFTPVLDAVIQAMTACLSYGQKAG